MNQSTSCIDRKDVVRKCKSISLVLPAWNEAAAIRRAISEADEALRDIAGRYEIIVVDDGSRDETAIRVQQIAATNSAVRLVRHATNQGYGAALRSGFAAAQCDLVVFTDADSQFNLRELDRFVLLSQNYQIVCGYRIDRKDTPLRCLYSRVYNQLVKVLLGTGVRDVDCALKMFHRNDLQKLEITTNGFLVNSELLTQARQQCFSVVEVGVSHRPRIEGTSTVSIAHIPVVLASLLRYWWNSVQFPAANSSDGDAVKNTPTKPIGERKLLWFQAILLVVAAIVVFTKLDYPLIDRDETRYAEIPREMIDTGNWVLPQLNYEPYYDKPVLLYWLCAGSYSLFGISAWSARLVPAFFGMGTLATTIWFGNRLVGKQTSLLAGIMLLVSVGFLGASRALLIDGVLTFFTTVSLFAAYESMRNSSFSLRWWTLAAIACGFAFLTKGPVALVLLIPPVFVFGWLTQQASKPTLRHWLFLSGIVFAIAAPWFIAVSYQDANFAYEFFYKHNITRFAGAFHEQPFWYFFPVLMIAGYPWSFLTIPYVGFLTSRSDQAMRLRTPLHGYLLLWSGWCFAFFSMSRCKLPPYIIPATPALALMMAIFLGQVLFSKEKSWYLELSRKLSPWVTTGTTCLVGIVFGIVAMVLNLESYAFAWAMICLWSIGAGVVFALYRLRSDSHIGWSVCVASALVLACFALYREVPRIAQSRSASASYDLTLADGSSIGQLPIITLGREWAGVPFDLKRSDIHNCPQLDSRELYQYATKHNRILIVMQRKQELVELVDCLPKQTELTTIAERGPARWVMATVDQEFRSAVTADSQRSAHR